MSKQPGRLHAGSLHQAREIEEELHQLVQTRTGGEAFVGVSQKVQPVTTGGGGIAFALFYTVTGIPIARWADRGTRRSIIVLGLFVWSAMTALTGLARSFTHLALARVGVGLGEAACSQPAQGIGEKSCVLGTSDK